MTEIFKTICDFLATGSYKTLSIQGMARSGKTDLLQQITEHLQLNHREVVILYPNARLANQIHPYNSIYTYLYTSIVENDIPSSESFHLESEINEIKQKIKINPLKSNINSNDCVYLLDEAHLLSNSHFTTPDGKQYGSGCLLDDFFQFVNFKDSKRQVIFFGDPFQLQRSDILSRCDKILTLPRILPNEPNLSCYMRNLAKLAEAIDTQNFTSLSLHFDNQIRKINDKFQAANELVSHYETDPQNTIYLAETHSQTYEFNKWIRKKINLKNNISINDLLEVYTYSQNQDIDAPNKLIISSGTRIIVKQTSNLQKQSQPLTGRDNPIPFHTMTINDNYLCLLEFLLNEKPELHAELAIAIQVWQKQKIKNGNLQKIKKGKDDNLMYARYAYSATVHHTQGMRFPRVYINANHSAGKHSDGFFRWLYSALSISNEEIILINMPEINALDKAIWKTNNKQIKQNITLGAGWNWQSETLYQAAIQQNLPITQTAEHAYQSQFTIQFSSENNSTLRIAFNGKNRVTAIHCDQAPIHWQVFTNFLSACISLNEYTQNQIIVLDCFRQYFTDWRIVSAIPDNDFRLTLVLARKFDERIEIAVYFDKNAIVSSIHLLAISSEILFDEMKEKWQ